MGFGDRSKGRDNCEGKYGRPIVTMGLFTIGNSHCAAARLLLAEFLELQARRADEAYGLRPVSYTHLTLPTNREV